MMRLSVGGVNIVYHIRGEGRCMVIGTIAVADASMRRQGLGRRALRYLEEVVVPSLHGGVDVIEVFAQDAGAFDFWQRVGFVSECPDYPALRMGCMRKILRGGA